jgi:hypothetical protein
MKGKVIKVILISLACLFIAYAIFASFQGGFITYTEKIFGCRRMSYESFR